MGVRPAAEEDVEAIAALLEDAFERPDEARLFRALWGSDELAVVLVHDGLVHDGASEHDEAEAAGAVAAVAVLSHLVEPEGALALGPIAVARDRRDRGFGKALIGASIDWATENRHSAIFVLGQPEYYTRFGFSTEAARPFESPYPAEFMLALELERGALKGGELRYPPAFAALG